MAILFSIHHHTLLIIVWAFCLSVISSGCNAFRTPYTHPSRATKRPIESQQLQTQRLHLLTEPSSITSLRNQRSRLLAENPGNSEKSTTKQPHIVILGGGFGGVNTALTLPTLPWFKSASTKDGKSATLKPRITLIDKSQRFVFLPLLYELCVEDASIDEVAPTFKSLLDRGGSGGGLGALPSLPSLPNLSNLIGQHIDASRRASDETYLSFVRGVVEGIDVKNQQVVITRCENDSIETIDYDALVVATGAEMSLDAIPGASKYALPFYTVEQCLELKRRLALLDSYFEEKKLRAVSESFKSPLNIVVVGGGYSGVELALNLADRLGSGDFEGDVEVILVHRGKQILQYATEYNRNAGIERLKSAGVNVMTSTSVAEILPGDDTSDESKNDIYEPTLSSLEKQRCVVKLYSAESNESGEDELATTLLPTTLLLWTAGATPTSTKNTGVRNSLLPRDIMGRIITSPTLNVPEYPNVFAIGDCSRPKKVPYPATAQVAIQMATVASWNIYATLLSDMTDGKRVTGEPNVDLLPFSYLNLGEMMTLGSNDATISSLGGRLELSGPAASWLRRLIYAVRMPTLKQGAIAALDGTERKLVREVAGSLNMGSAKIAPNKESRRSSKPVEWT